MEIVIKISDELYERTVKKNSDDCATFTESALVEIIQNSTPLPKGHGRLIDADSLQKKYCDDNCGARKCVDAMDRCVFMDAVLDAKTIIEADKEDKNGD